MRASPPEKAAAAARKRFCCKDGHRLPDEYFSAAERRESSLFDAMKRPAFWHRRVSSSKLLIKKEQSKENYLHYRFPLAPI
jgi:hypothetical protein